MHTSRMVLQITGQVLDDRYHGQATERCCFSCLDDRKARHIVRSMGKEKVDEIVRFVLRMGCVLLKSDAECIKK